MTGTNGGEGALGSHTSRSHTSGALPHVDRFAILDGAANAVHDREGAYGSPCRNASRVAALCREPHGNDTETLARIGDASRQGQARPPPPAPVSRRTWCCAWRLPGGLPQGRRLDSSTETGR
jgi:hypothetical protein